MMFCGPPTITAKEALRRRINIALGGTINGDDAGDGGDLANDATMEDKQVSTESSMARHQVDTGLSSPDIAEEGIPREGPLPTSNNHGATSPIAKWETSGTRISADNQGKSGESGSSSSSHRGLSGQWQADEQIRVLVPEKGVQSTTITTATSPLRNEDRKPQNPIGPNFWAEENSNDITES